MFFSSLQNSENNGVEMQKDITFKVRAHARFVNRDYQVVQDFIVTIPAKSSGTPELRQAYVWMMVHEKLGNAVEYGWQQINNSSAPTKKRKSETKTGRTGKTLKFSAARLKNQGSKKKAGTTAESEIKIKAEKEKAREAVYKRFTRNK